LPVAAIVTIAVSFGAGLATAAVAVNDLAQSPPPSGGTVAVFTVLSALVGLMWLRPILLYRDHESEAVHLDEGLLVLMILLLPAPLPVFGFAVPIAAAQAIRRRSLVKSTFNWGQVVTAVGLGTLASRTITVPGRDVGGRALAAAAVGAAVFFIANNASMAAILSALGTPWRTAVREGLTGRILVLGASIAVGGTLALAVAAHTWYVALAVIPILVLRHLVSGHFQAQHDRSRLLGLLRVAMRANQSLRQGDVVAPLVESARNLLRCSDAALTSAPPKPCQLAAEMSVKGQPVWLVLSGRGRNEPLDAADVELLQALAAIGTGALTNSSLYEEVRQQRERLSAITGSLGEGVCAVDDSGAVTFLNPAAKQMLGVTNNEIDTTGALDFLRQPSQEAMLSRGLSRRNARAVCRADGMCFPVELTASPILQDDRPVGAVIVFRDISERQELEQTRARLMAFLDASPDFVSLSDREGHASYVNPAGRVIVGLDPHAPVASFNLADFYPAWSDAMRPTVVAAVARDHLWRGESSLIDRAGREITVDQIVVALHNSEGDEEFFATTARDITELRHLEDQLHQSQKMEALGRLAGGVAHDFNNVLAVISLCAELLASTVDKANAEFVAEIGAAAERAAALTDQLLTFSRRQHFDVGPLDPVEVIVAVQQMLHRLIGEHIVVSTAVSAAAGCCVEVDRGRLEQVIMNLVLNARDAMPDGGALRIEASPVEMTADNAQGLTPGGYLRISVSDTGVGMTPETQAHLFEPFFTTKARGQGTGLGLSTVEGIVAQSRGRISVESRLGVGTKVSLYLPLVTATDPPGPGGNADLHPVDQPVDATVLLVEDDAAVRNVEALVLRAAGYRVLEASDGVAGLEAAMKYRGEITVVVSDVLMPGLSGPVLVEALRRMNPDIHVLLVSAYTEDHLKGTLAASEYPLLAKPFTASALLGVVDAMARRSSRAAAGAVVAGTTPRVASPGGPDPAAPP
jgi:PAS domain S-box-containing protein